MLSSTGCWGGGEDGGCTSVYDGTYIGEFVYEWRSLTDDTTGTDGFNLTIVLTCGSKSSDTVYLWVTSATVDDPYFVCQVDGCTPEPGYSFANLPAQPPTTPSNPSQAGHGIAIRFTNQASIETIREPGCLSVTSSGRILSDAPACAGNSWSAGSWAEGAENFPGGDRTIVGGVSWSLTNSAL